jgi:hypothetical protein
MSRSYIPKTVRERVAAEAKSRCGYCLTNESIVGTPMQIDHLFPEALGGSSEEENLWLACALCNDSKMIESWLWTWNPGSWSRCSIHAVRSGVSILLGRRKATGLLG